MNKTSSGLAGLVCLTLLLSGCSNLYYNTMERLGYEKRDIMVSRVENARDAQSDAQETFRSALERYQSMVDTPDSDLRRMYEDIRRAYEDSVKAAERVTSRIDAVEDVADDLFDEWEDELGRYENQSLRRDSERQLQETRTQYESLIIRMRAAEAQMSPVLSAFQDQMLYLRHNLNAQAIGALETELSQIRSDVDNLIRNMEQAIAESEAFIRRFQSQ